MPRGVPHAWKNTDAETGRVLFLYTPAEAGGFFEVQLNGRPGRSMKPRPMKSAGVTGGRLSVRRLSSCGVSESYLV
jgi:hypothetical protein